MKYPTRDLAYLAVIILLIGLCGQFYYSYKLQPQYETRVYYSYDRGLNKEIIDTIQSADEFVYFAVYTFTRQDIADAIMAAKYRGLEVIGITDRKQYNAIEAQKKIINDLRKEGITVFEQDHSGIMHLKTVVTEKSYASGSYNWTASATTINDEVLEIGLSPTIRKQYQTVLEELFKKYSEPR